MKTLYAERENLIDEAFEPPAEKIFAAGAPAGGYP